MPDEERSKDPEEYEKARDACEVAYRRVRATEMSVAYHFHTQWSFLEDARMCREGAAAATILACTFGLILAVTLIF